MLITRPCEHCLVPADVARKGDGVNYTATIHIGYTHKLALSFWYTTKC